MSNTLRRKMFKLGGSANTHGVGITSGLKMNKGGRVGFQQGKLVNPNLRNTPTGGDFLKIAMQGDPNFNPNFQPLSQQVQPTANFLSNYFSNVPAGRFVSDVAKAGATQAGYAAGGLYDLLIGNPASAVTEFFTGVDPQFTARNLVGAEDGDPILNIADAGKLFSSTKIEEDDKPKESPLFAPPSQEPTVQQADEGTEAAPALTEAEEQQAVAEKENEKLQEAQNQIKEIAGDDAIDLDTELTEVEEIKQRAEALSELYETDSKTKLLSDILLAGSAELLKGEGADSYAAAGKAVGDVLSRQAKNLQDVKNAVTTAAIRDVTTKRAAEKDRELRREIANTQAQAAADNLQAQLTNQAMIAEERNKVTREVADDKIDASQAALKLQLIGDFAAVGDERAVDKANQIVEGEGTFTLVPLYKFNDEKDGKRIKLDDPLFDKPMTDPERINQSLLVDNTLYLLGGRYYFTKQDAGGNIQLIGPYDDADGAKNGLAKALGG
jgi:hypothetical protein